MKVSAHELCLKNLPLIKYTGKLNYHVSFYLADSTTSTSRIGLDSGCFVGEDEDGANGDMCTPSGHHQDIDNVDIVKMQKVITVTILWKMFRINLFIDVP